VLCQGYPLIKGSAGVLAQATLFLTIMRLTQPTRGGRQCWKKGFLVGGTRKDNEGLHAP